MKAAMRLAATSLLLISPAAFGQVYKCTVNGGTVYSQTPCGSDAVPVKVHAAPKVRTDTTAPRAAASGSVDVSDAAIAERICLQNSEGPIYRASNSRVSQYESQIGTLNRQISLANNNLAGATYESGLRTQIAAIQQSIASERASADTLAANARQSCMSRRTQQEAEIRERAALR